MRLSYFRQDEFARYAPGLKSLGNVETIRAKILYQPFGSDAARFPKLPLDRNESSLSLFGRAADAS
jgi:hypothetical protein